MEKGLDERIKRYGLSMTMEACWQDENDAADNEIPCRKIDDGDIIAALEKVGTMEGCSFELLKKITWYHAELVGTLVMDRTKYDVIMDLWALEERGLMNPGNELNYGVPSSVIQPEDIVEGCFHEDPGYTCRKTVSLCCECPTIDNKVSTQEHEKNAIIVRDAIFAKYRDKQA